MSHYPDTDIHSRRVQNQREREGSARSASVGAFRVTEKKTDGLRDKIASGNRLALFGALRG